MLSGNCRTSASIYDFKRKKILKFDKTDNSCHDYANFLKTD